MKRYTMEPRTISGMSENGLSATHVEYIEDPDGEWVKWEDAEQEIAKLHAYYARRLLNRETKSGILKFFPDAEMTTCDLGGFVKGRWEPLSDEEVNKRYQEKLEEDYPATD